MPVDVPSLRGKCEYEVETAITRLAAAVNQLEGSISAAALADLRSQTTALRQGLGALTQRVDDLLRRVQALENP